MSRSPSTPTPARSSSTTRARRAPARPASTSSRTTRTPTRRSRSAACSTPTSPTTSAAWRRSRSRRRRASIVNAVSPAPCTARHVVGMFLPNAAAQGARPGGARPGRWPRAPAPCGRCRSAAPTTTAAPFITAMFTYAGGVGARAAKPGLSALLVPDRRVGGADRGRRGVGADAVPAQGAAARLAAAPVASRAGSARRSSSPSTPSGRGAQRGHQPPRRTRPRACSAARPVRPAVHGQRRAGDHAVARDAAPGDVVRLELPGGGGYGDADASPRGSSGRDVDARGAGGVAGRRHGAPRRLVQRAGARARRRAAGGHRGVADRSLVDIGRDAFPLPTFGAVLATVLDDVVAGRGFALLRGVPVDGLAEARWNASTGVSAPTSASASARTTRATCWSTSRTRDSTSRTPRCAATRRRSAWSTTAIRRDVVGLLCVHPALQGGVSTIVSAGAVFEEAVRRRPDLAGVLTAPWWWDKRKPDLATSFFQRPIFTVHDGAVVSYYGRAHIESAVRGPQVPELTAEQVAALDLLDELANDPDLVLPMDFRPGDVQLLNNYRIWHARTAYVDDPDPPSRPVPPVADAAPDRRRCRPPSRPAASPTGRRRTRDRARVGAHRVQRPVERALVEARRDAPFLRFEGPVRSTSPSGPTASSTPSSVACAGLHRRARRRAR